MAGKFSRLTPGGVRTYFPPCSRYFVASEGDTAASSCKQSLRSRRAEVLPLPFVVMLSLIVASDYSHAVPSQLHHDYMATANFDTFRAILSYCCDSVANCC